MLEHLDKYKYIHIKSNEILEFAKEMSRDEVDTEHIIKNIFRWFDQNMEYSRLDSPYYPLQRSDIDTLRMKSGTCGDYSNLIVSTLLNLGIPAKYTFVKKDCYGHYQDHVCAMAKVNNDWILIDATLPYRKWWGYKTPHKEYDIYTPDEFEQKFKKEERYWSNLALKWREEKYAGLLYAPWIHEEIIINRPEVVDSVLYLLIFNDSNDWNIYAYYLHYTSEEGRTPIMAIINLKGITYRFSINQVKSIWDEEQWSEKYELEDIPKNYKDEKFIRLNNNISNIIYRIEQIIP